MRSTLFSEANVEIQTTERFVAQSSKMLKVTLGNDILALKGAMVAYQGHVQFEHEGSGSVGRLIRKLVSSDDAPLMRVSGQGEVFFASRAQEVFLVTLEGDGLSVNGQNLLAFDAEHRVGHPPRPGRRSTRRRRVQHGVAGPWPGRTGQ